ncbi:hypothetical protein [Bradyrhizobium sp. SZCCHNRI2049]|uniref:hypothetical protein n=1 Tax=Bradyrhizobium sp. SZCCHNRI2049 TaxID=3057287 RepID=UPI002915D62E|nr:hypothetical protein [Bradyrhizobium sp. SZCCHNRI2049]
MDTTFPTNEEQVAKDNKALQSYAEEIDTPPQAPEGPAPSPVDPQAEQLLINENWAPTDRRYKGFGNITAYPNETDVQKLRQNQNDPMMIKLFDSMYGNGSSKRYINYPSLNDVTRLLVNKDDPEFVKLWDRTYGDLSKYIVPLYDPRTSAEDKQGQASHINSILNSGKSWADKLADSSISEAVRSAELGVKGGVLELARSGAQAYDWATHAFDRNTITTDVPLADSVPEVTDTRHVNHPLVDGAIQGVSQFLTGRVIAGALTGGTSNIADVGKLGMAVREMKLAAFVNAFAFNPHDPLLGDLATSLGVKPNVLTNLDSIENYKSDLAKRAARAGEGAVLGLAVDGLIAAARAVKAYRAGDIKGAEAAKAEAAEKLGHFDNGMANAKQGELPLGNMNDPNAAAQVRIDRADAAGRTGVPETATQQALPLDLPIERRIDQPPAGAIPAVPRESLSAMEARMMDKWGVSHQLNLDLGAPKSGPYTHGLPGEQGDLFPRTSPLPKAAEEAPKLEPQGLPKSYSQGELFDTSREQFVKDQIEQNPPLVRETKQDIEGPRPARTEVPDSIRSVLDNIPDFRNYSVQGIRQAVTPLLKDFLRVSERSPVELERIMTSELHPQDVQKVQALTSLAVGKAEREAAQIGAKLEAFKKAKVTDAAEISQLEAGLKDAHDFLRDLQKLDYPLGTFAGRLLQQRQIEARLTAARRVDITKLRGSGVSEERINEMLRTAMDMTDTTRLSDLTYQRMLALNTGDLSKVERIDQLIKAEMKDVERKANSKFSALHNKIASDIASYTIANILSGFGTTIRNVIGIFGHLGLYRANQLMGAIDQHGFVDGARSYWMQVKARRMALRSGFVSTLDMLGKTLADAAVDAYHGESKAHVGSPSGSMNRISGEKYGLTGVGGKVLTGFGRSVEMLTLPLRFSDEVASDMISRHAIGTRSAFNFFENLVSQRHLLQAKLRDPKLTATQRAGLQASLDELKGNNPTLTIDGQKQTFKDYIDHQVKQAFDGNGRLVDANAIDETNYILLRNRQTPSAFGQAIETAINSTPYIRFLIPVFNAPMNGFKRGFETVPVLRHLLTDLDSELKSADPYVRSMARGKLGTAYAMMGTAFLLADMGLVTRGSPTTHDKRLSDAASSGPGPYQLKIGNTSWDLSGLDPISIPFIWAAEFKASLDEYIAAHDQEANIQDHLGTPIPILEQRLTRLQDVGLALMGATGQAIVQNPAVSGLKDLVELLSNVAKASDDEHALSKDFTKLARGQLGKLVPNLWKQGLGLFDQKRYDPATIMDVLNAAAGNTSSSPMLYDVMGRPIENKQPLRSLLGPLSYVNTPDKASKAQYVIDTLDNWGNLTGHYYTFDTTPPDSVLRRYGVDLRTIPSTVERKVQDQFAKNYREVEINGQKIDSALYTVVTTIAENQLPLGNNQQRSSVWSQIDGIVNEYKQLAWELTLRKEFANKNTALFGQTNAGYAMKQATQNPLFDRPTDNSIQTRTQEMLRQFPLGQ